MSILKFSDGIEFETSGPLRIEKRKDGFYLVGEGTLCAIKDEAEGERLIQNRKNPFVHLRNLQSRSKN